MIPPGPPAPGCFVDVDGAPAQVVVRGDGGPAVVVDSGLGGGVLEWGPVADALSQTTTVVLRDRPGLGWSPYTKRDRSALGAARELHQVLALVDVAPPYVLVGHSLGGLHVRAFAATYPDEVAGIVLVDPSHEGVFTNERVAKRGNQVMLALLGSASIVPAIGGRALLGTYARMMKATFTAPIAPETDRLMDIGRRVQRANPYWVRAMRDELRAIPTSCSQMRSLRAQHPLPAVPLRVISQGRPEAKARAREMAARFREYHADLVTLAEDSQHLIAERSGHIVPFDQPEIIVDAVTEVLARCR